MFALCNDINVWEEYDKFAVFLSHDGSQPPSDVYELFPIELSENYSNSKSFIEYNLLSDIKLNCPDETRDFG